MKTFFLVSYHWGIKFHTVTFYFENFQDECHLLIRLFALRSNSVLRFFVRLSHSAVQFHFWFITHLSTFYKNDQNLGRELPLAVLLFITLVKGIPIRAQDMKGPFICYDLFELAKALTLLIVNLLSLVITVQQSVSKIKSCYENPKSLVTTVRKMHAIYGGDNVSFNQQWKEKLKILKLKFQSLM